MNGFDYIEIETLPLELQQEYRCIEQDYDGLNSQNYNAIYREELRQILDRDRKNLLDKINQLLLNL